MAFPTPVVNYRWPDVQQLNEALIDVILRHESRQPGVVRSNVGGWHSDTDFLAWKDDGIQELHRRLHAFVVELNQSVLRPDAVDAAGSFALEGWANVLRGGQYNSLHNHPNASWSGVYYVTGNPPCDDHPFSGRLELVDPRPGASLTYAENTTLYGRFLLNPVAGQMLLFPAWLQHQVHPVFGDEPRISVAFNVLAA